MRIVTNDGVTAARLAREPPHCYEPGNGSFRHIATAVATFNRDLSVSVRAPALRIETTGNTPNNERQHQHAARLGFGGGGTAASAMVINGNISGAGILSDAFRGVSNTERQQHL